jgi:predicted translin family RNA/ssDNA-binding protein
MPILMSMCRVKQLNKDIPPNIQKDIDTRLAEISKLLVSIAPDLQSLNRHRYSGSLRCLEELIEALSFMHYLRNQTLITVDETQAAVPAEVAITHNDYMYGVFDLFGELMRFATVTTAQTGKLVGGREDDSDEERRNILADIHELGCAYEMLPDMPGKDYRSKMTAMRQSIRKVEMLGYGIVVRGSERPKGWVPDMREDAAPAEAPSP